VSHSAKKPMNPVEYRTFAIFRTTSECSYQRL